MKIFVAHSLKFLNKALDYEQECKATDPSIEFYIPGRDTPQTCGDEIIVKNRDELIKCDECHVIWDGVSFGTLFDAGMAYGRQMPVKIINIIPQSWTTYMQTKKGEYLIC